MKRLDNEAKHNSNSFLSLFIWIFFKEKFNIAIQTKSDFDYPDLLIQLQQSYFCPIPASIKYQKRIKK